MTIIPLPPLQQTQWYIKDLQYSITGAYACLVRRNNVWEIDLMPVKAT